MASALDGTSRDIVYQICQWGVGTDIGTWLVLPYTIFQCRVAEICVLLGPLRLEIPGE